MADIGFNIKMPLLIEESLLLGPDANPGQYAINQKIQAVRNFNAGKDPNDVWYKFTVLKSTDYSKEFILRSILDAVNSKFVPVKFFTENGDSIFYGKYCMESLSPLIRQNFAIRVHSNNVLLRLRVEVGTKDKLPEVNINDLVALIVQRRVGKDSATLDLSNFHSEPELEAYCFFPLSISQNLLKVIKCADHFASGSFLNLDLSNNQIKNLNSLAEKLSFFGEVKCVDLRNNQLTLSYLQSISHLPITDLKLDGNPLCELYNSDFEYVKDVQNLFPSLKLLDGCALSSPGYFVLRRFHSLDSQSKMFMEQFLTHYYSILESDKRHLLLGLYHSDALFSMTSSFLPAQSTSTNANLSEYLNESRNFKKCSDWGKIDELLYKGSKQILDFIKKLPEVQHDISSFTADMLIFDSEKVKISVTGLFREPGNKFSSVRFFKRNFVLNCFNKVYLITNDMLYISNCTSEQAVVAFRSKQESSLPLDLYLSTRSMHVSLSNEQKVKMVEKISDITSMNQEWSRRCLEDVQYDLRNALVYFQKHYAERAVPQEAFIK